jgi:hypothetical protein
MTIGDQSGRAVQVWRGRVRPGHGSNKKVRGKAQGICLQQDQRWSVHFSAENSQPYRGK